MAKIENPALKEFVASIGSESVLAQVLIRRSGAGYELRQVDDLAVTAEALRLLNLNEVRTVAQTAASGEFRPLKSAPTLQRGWRFQAANDAELDAALSCLYPGAVADWHAVQSAHPPVTNYREYTNRQSGMFRVTAKLSDAQAAEVIRGGCAAKSCLKRRLWSVPGLDADAAAVKSIIPCLEPCAVLMEAARRMFRAEQPENPGMKLAASAEAG